MGGTAPPGDLDEAQRWYNSYRFAGHTIYNPWSVLSSLTNVDEPAQPYWLNAISLEWGHGVIHPSTRAVCSVRPSSLGSPDAGRPSH